MTPLIEARQLHVRIGERTIVSDLNCTLVPGERLAILGRNGAGKSTLLSTLAGLRPPTAGQIFLQGQDYQSLSAREAALGRAWLGQFQQDPFGTTVLETVLTGRHPHLGRWDWESPKDYEIAQRALAALGLEGMEQRQVHTLSGGERQRLSLATLLTQGPLLYLLDEPLSYLDLNHQMAVLALFRRTAQDCGAGIILVLHDPALAYRFSDRVLLLHDDGRAELGGVSEMLTAEKLSHLYGHPLKQLDLDGQRCFIPL